MNKTTKGALAAVAAVALLVGGAQTIAYWTDDAAVNAGTITAGSLSLTPVAAGTWTDTTTDEPITIGTFRVVPGDTLEYSATFTVGAVGDNLAATIAVDEASVTGDLLDEATVTVTVLDEDGVTELDTITSDNDGDTITVNVTFDFPFTPATNDSQTETADLTGLVLNLIQTEV